MNILYVSSDSAMGGASQSLVDMLNAVGSYVTPIVVIPAKGDLEKELIKINVKYYIIPLSRGFSVIGTHSKKDEDLDFKINFEAALSMQPIIRNEKIDVIHINSSVCNAGAMAAILADIPYVWHLRELPEKQFDCEFWDVKVKQLLFDKASKIIAISDCVESDYRERYGLECLTLYDAIDSKRYWQDIGHKGDENHTFLLPGASAMTKNKGQLDAIKAVLRLRYLGIDDIKLILVGAAPQRVLWCIEKYVKKYGLENNIVVYPFMSDLSELRNKSSFALVTSKFEALGRVTVEAMLAGNIVVGADTAGTLEIIETTMERGILYRQGDVESLVKSMMVAIDMSDNEKHDMRAAAQQYALEKFNSSDYAKTINDIYNEIKENCIPQFENIRDMLSYRYSLCKNSYVCVNKEAAINKKDIINDILKLWDKDNVIDFLVSKGIKTIIIYGMGKLGMRLYDECINSDIEVVGVMDKDDYLLSEVVNMIGPFDDIPKVDAIVVTAIFDYENIRDMLKKRTNVEIINVGDSTLPFEGDQL
jgi:glycosyltransferase involved in cell wall biosynthesis